MTMHLLGPWYTTTKTDRKQKQKEKQITKHDVGLLKNGVHPEQIKIKKGVDLNWKQRYNDNMKVERNDYVSAGMSGSASSCVKRDIMSNLHKESKQVQAQILAKASRVMPLFNKGGLQYATPETDLTQVGSKSRRG
jgi:hypothetical protein